jgi:hypothetical protein
MKSDPTTRRPLLHVTYFATVHWADPILNNIAAHPSFRVADRGWRAGKLSDLAFAIETRLGYLPLIVHDVDESLATVQRDLPATPAALSSYLDRPKGRRAAVTLHDREAATRLLIRVASFIAESRACFENLAEFLRVFSRDYLHQPMGRKAALDAIAMLTRRRRWATQLQAIRHDVLHERSLFLAFEPQIRSDRVHYEAMFLLNWRPEKDRVPQDRVSMATLRAIRRGLVESAAVLRRRLGRQRVRTVPA